MKNILIPTDFSHNAYNAIFHATRLLKGKIGNFYLLNVYDEHTSLQSNSTGKNLLQQLADESQEGLQQAYYKIRLDEREPQHIFQTIKEKEIDLVIMGNSDMIAFLNRKHRFFSSILSNPLIKEIGYDSKIPILVLKDNS